MTELQLVVRFTKSFAEGLRTIPAEELHTVDLEGSYAEYCKAAGAEPTCDRRALLDDVQELYAEQIGEDRGLPTWRTLLEGLEMRGWRRTWLCRALPG